MNRAKKSSGIHKTKKIYFIFVVKIKLKEIYFVYKSWMNKIQFIKKLMYMMKVRRKEIKELLVSHRRTIMHKNQSFICSPLRSEDIKEEKFFKCKCSIKKK